MARKVEMVFWNVQHGNSTYIKSPNGKHIVVDLGVGSSQNKDEEFSPLLHLKTKYNVQQLDYVIITHPHKDHIADINNFVAVLPKVLGVPYKFTREEIFTDKISESDRSLYEKYMAIADYYKLDIEYDNPKNPDNPANFGDLKIKSFHNIRNGSTLNINNDSGVTVFEYATIKVIIPGDNETSSLKEMIEDPVIAELLKDADILLAPHHGRAEGFCKEFVELVNPRVTVISDSSYSGTNKGEWYANNSRGWKVHYNNGKSIYEGKVLSTYYNGVIVVSFGWDEANKPFLNIRIS
jgi:competence protein ComEC